MNYQLSHRRDRLVAFVNCIYQVGMKTHLNDDQHQDWFLLVLSFLNIFMMLGSAWPMEVGDSK